MKTHKFHKKSYNDSLATVGTSKYFMCHNVLTPLFLIQK